MKMMMVKQPPQAQPFLSLAISRGFLFAGFQAALVTFDAAFVPLDNRIVTSGHADFVLAVAGLALGAARALDRRGNAGVVLLLQLTFAGNRCTTILNCALVRFFAHNVCKLLFLAQVIGEPKHNGQQGDNIDHQKSNDG